MSLKRLLEMQNQKKAPTNVNQNSQAANRDDASGSGATTSNVDSDGAEPVSPELVAPSTPKPASGLRLNIAGKAPGPVGGTDKGSQPNGGVAKPRLQGLKLAGSNNTPAKREPRTTPNAVDVGESDFSLADLAAAESADEGSVIRGRSPFLDEIDATAPTRELPADLTQQQLQFVDSLDGIYTVLDDPEMFGQIVRNIMMELSDNHEYAKLIVDQDMHTMIRAMRNTMGLAKIKKTESKTKRGTGTGRGKKLNESDAEMLNSLEGLAGFDGGDM